MDQIGSISKLSPMKMSSNQTREITVRIHFNSDEVDATLSLNKSITAFCLKQQVVNFLVSGKAGPKFSEMLGTNSLSVYEYGRGMLNDDSMIELSKSQVPTFSFAGKPNKSMLHVYLK